MGPFQVVSIRSGATVARPIVLPTIAIAADARTVTIPPAASVSSLRTVTPGVNAPGPARPDPVRTTAGAEKSAVQKSVVGMPQVAVFQDHDPAALAQCAPRERVHTGSVMPTRDAPPSRSGDHSDAAPVKVRLLGQFGVDVDGTAASGWRRDAAALVKVLALSPARSLHRERLMDVLWAELDADTAASRLHKAAHFARRATGRQDAVVLRGDLVTLFPGGEISVDIEDFAVAADRAGAAGTISAAAAALDRYPDEPLPADPYEPWAHEVRERHALLRTRLLRQAERWDQVLVADPADEEAHLALMRRHVRDGDRSAALRQFERMDRALRSELGVGPSPAAVRLREQVISAMRDLEPLTIAEEVRLEQRIRFCRTADDVTIAYATTGTGPPLVKAANWMTHLDHDWHSPVWRHWLVDLSRRHQLIRYDERGCGLSDREIPDQSFEAWVRDLETVVDAAEVDRFDLLGISQGGGVAMEYAARHPERVRRLVLYGTYVQGRVARAVGDEDLRNHRLQIELARLGWGSDDPAFRMYFTAQFMPGGSKELWDAFNELQRQTCSPENAAAVLQLCGEVDVRAAAMRVRSPTLVLHARDDRRPPFEQGRTTAALIPDSRFVALDSSNHILLAEEPAWRVFLGELEAFLGGSA